MEYLKQSELVVKIQNFFGVKKLKESEDITSNLKKCSSETKFVIDNKFWYYVFMFGTALGDETFYSAFIPFWFWNIDGAVGRRVVLVWAIVMYIGMFSQLFNIVDNFK